METLEAPIALFSKRSSKSKSNLRKRAATPPPTQSDSDSGQYSSSDDGCGQKFKRRRKDTGVVAASSATSRAKEETLGASLFEADRSKTINAMEEATKHSNWFDEGSEDELGSKNSLGITRSRLGAAAEAEAQGIYKGSANYKSFIPKNPNAPSRQVGPIKAPTNIRTITVTDFAPDVCKDYKQTGFCGFGDSCKFLHAREDYKQGWELDRDWKVGTKGKKIAGTTMASANKSVKARECPEDEDDELLDNIPFACIICKKPYTNPIVTKCGHYFCEACALNRYRKSPSCAICGAGTGGVFNTAKNLKKLLDKKRERARKRAEKEGEGGLDVSADDQSDDELDS